MMPDPSTKARVKGWYASLLDRPELAATILVLGVAVVVRALLFGRMSVLLTNDSPDYLLAGDRILRALDFSSEHLRDWRLPGYPVFLASVQALAGWSAASVVLAQKVLGVICVGVAVGLLCRLGRPMAALGLGLFLALNPILLFVEHLVMTEPLFIALLWIFVLTCGLALHSSLAGTSPAPLGFGRGLVIGLIMGACVLTRASGLFFCVPLAAGTALAQAWRHQGTWAVRLRRVRGFVVGVLLGSILLLGLWVLRNAVTYGEASITLNSHRNRVVYLSTHRLIDPNLTRVAPYAFDQDDLREAGYQIAFQLGTGSEAESLARAIVREQISARPGEYLLESVRSLAHFFGWPLANPPPGSEDLRDWIYRFADDGVALDVQNQIVLASAPALSGVERRVGGGLSTVWKEVGVLYLSHGRGALFAVFVFSVVAFVWTGGLRMRSAEQVVVTLIVLGVSLTAASHALLLADFDRYAVPWDGFQALVVALVATQLAERLRTKYLI